MSYIQQKGYVRRLAKEEYLIRPNFEHLLTPLQIDFEFMPQNTFLIFVSNDTPWLERCWLLWNFQVQLSFLDSLLNYTLALFTDHCLWQNFYPSVLRLVNNCVESIFMSNVYEQDAKNKNEKFCHLQWSVNSTLTIMTNPAYFGCLGFD